MVNGIKSDSLTLIGLDAAWGGCESGQADGASAFERMIYNGGQGFAQAGNRPRTGQAEDWLVKSALRALVDAGVETGSGGARIVLLFASDQPAAPRPEWATAAENLSQAANALPEALERATRLLNEGAADVVVYAAAGNREVDWNSVVLAEGAAMGLDRSVHGYRFGWGAGAVVLQSYGQASQDNRRIYAILRGMATAAGANHTNGNDLPVPPSLDDVRACCRTALDQAGTEPEQVGYVEMFAMGSDAIDGVEIAGLCQAYRTQGGDLTTAIGSAQGNLGYLFAAAGLAGCIRTTLCLYHRIVPQAPGWTAPKLPALWRGAPFYVPCESRPWFARLDGPGRFAGVNAIGKGGSFAHLILSENPQQVERMNHALVQGGFYLFPMVADSLDGLLEQLEELQDGLPYEHDLANAAAECYEMAQEHREARYGLSILGHNHEEVLREIELALKSVPTAFEKNGEWQTPLGSCFTAEPAGKLGPVAFVYPGAFNSYPFVGKDLFHLFPWLFSRSFGRTLDLGRVVRDRQLYPRSLAAPTKEELAAFEAKLLSNPMAMLTSGTTVAILYTYILEEAFNIRARAAFGYSLGENSMMYATRIWQEGDEATSNLENGALFRERLAGPQNAIRAYWGLPEVEQSGDSPLWNNYLVMAPWEAVRPALEQEEHVYLTHINTPRQVVIGGDPQGCKRVIARLRCSSLQAPFDYALHCEPMRSEFDALAKLHEWPVEQLPSMQLYSAADYGPLDLEMGQAGALGLSQKIAKTLVSPLDFPKLVRRVYEDGARVFIETGAGSNCGRWIDETLKNQPHLSLSINRRGTDDYTSIVRLLARLHSHRVPLDLSVLYMPAHYHARFNANYVS